MRVIAHLGVLIDVVLAVILRIRLFSVRSSEPMKQAAMFDFQTHPSHRVIASPEYTFRRHESGSPAIANSAADAFPRVAKAGSGRAALSIDVEDWFHAANLAAAVPPPAWNSCELRVERNTMRMLEILEASKVRATFFVLGWVAERIPKLVRTIAEAGHEVACHGHVHQLVYSLQPNEFRADVSRAKHYLEDLLGMPVRGYRAPSFSITDWAIPILQELGFAYDSSFVPTIAHDLYGKLSGVDSDRPIALLSQGFHEVCISCLRIGKRGIPWGGGGYFRLVPYPLWIRGVRAVLRAGRPYVFYIHPWEIDPGQPRVSGVKPIQAFRHRVNLAHCEQRFTALAGAFSWMTIGDLIADYVGHDSR
jgi:polysaccharide deacetylase family protein (PEP-CTERM system associated)